VIRRDFERELAIARAAALAVGHYIREQFKLAPDVRYKHPNDPVTNVDQAADRLLRTTLLRNFPFDGWLSEETADTPERLTKERVWVVDPLDGTKEFIAHRAEFTISIALVYRQTPVVGIVYNPLSEEMFHAAWRKGCFFNGVQCHCPDTSVPGQARLLVSRSEAEAGRWQPYQAFFRELEARGSTAYKIACVAAGQADLYISLKPKNLWDVAAGACLMQEAGGIVISRLGLGIRFNRRRTVIPKGVIAGNTPLLAAVQQLRFNS